MTLTIILILFTVVISYQAIQNPELFAKLAFHPVSIANNGEYYRFITHGFIHSNRSYNHLLINMFVLYQIGEAIEYFFVAFFGDIMGKVVYLILYLTAIVISSIPSYYKHKTNYAYSAVGASGATSALVFAFILFQPWEWFIFPPLPGVFLAIGYLVYSNYASKNYNDNIGHDAHMYGAVYGLSFTLLAGFLLNTQALEFIVGMLLAGPHLPNF